MGNLFHLAGDGFAVAPVRNLDIENTYPGGCR